MAGDSDFKPYRSPVDSLDGFWISDLYAAAFLVARGHRIGSIHPTEQWGRFAFEFTADEKLDSDYEKFRHDEVISNFVAAIAYLKKLLREHEQDENRKPKHR